MKKKEWMVLMAVITMLALAACSNATGETATEETVTIPETSSEEVLVDSLKYLLNDGSAEEEQAAEDQTEVVQTAEETLSEEQSTQIHVLEAQKEEVQEEPVVYEEVTIYYGNGASSELKTEVTEVEEITAENLISALAKHNIVSLDTKVNAFEEQEVDGKKLVYLDLSKSFREYLKTMTQEGESIIIASVTDTFLEAYDADALVLMIDGATLETGNASYEEPLVFYKTEQIHEP